MGRPRRRGTDQLAVLKQGSPNIKNVRPKSRTAGVGEQDGETGEQENKLWKLFIAIPDKFHMIYAVAHYGLQH